MVTTFLFPIVKEKKETYRNHLHIETSGCIIAGEVKWTHRVEQCHYPANHN